MNSDQSENNFANVAYLDLLVKGSNGVLKLDFGILNENFYHPEIDSLDTEDTVNGVANFKLDSGEDVGFDGIPDKKEPGI